MSQWVQREVLITVKAYPEPSATYKETCCTAGITREDGWLRLYPIRFRDLPRASQFRKYQLVTLSMTRHERDKRPESYRPDEGSILPGRVLGAESNWRERKAWVLPTANRSMCEIQAQQKDAGKSLGVFKPLVVKDLKIIATGKDWTGRQKAKVSQLWFDDLAGKRRIEKIPYVFRYSYVCEEQGCKGHKQRIIDWELMQLCRRLTKQNLPPKIVEDKVRRKYLQQMCGQDRDTYLFVGNHSRYRTSFMVLGVFWPRKQPAMLFPNA